MVLRNIVKIDENKCNGCGECITACAEGAIKLVNGKAKLVSEIYCDGLGACLSHCPQNAITIEQREAEEFDEAATEKHLSEQKACPASAGFLCPGLANKQLREKTSITDSPAGGKVSSQLTHWPVQLRLLSPQAPFLKGADLLLVADCVPFAYGGLHEDFVAGRAVLVACPKLDDYQRHLDKLTEVFREAEVTSLTVLIMEVPCCGGLGAMARRALEQAGVSVPVRRIVIGINGEIIEEQEELREHCQWKLGDRKESLEELLKIIKNKLNQTKLNKVT